MKFAGTKTELLKLLGATAKKDSPDFDFSGAEFDSRRVAGGELFVALPGEKVHGEKYIEVACEKGASLCLIEDKALLDKSPVADRLLAVKSTLLAFQNLATLVRQKLPGKVIGITGTVGKTTTRNILTCILSQFGKVSSSQKSFNNHIGVPYSICNADLESNFVVLEMGMNHSGELHGLTSIAQPDVALITNVTPVHMEFFSDLSEVADAKCEILDGLQKKGIVLLNGDNSELNAAWLRWKEKHSPFEGTVRTFGSGGDNQVKIKGCEDKLTDGFQLQLQIDAQELSLDVPLIGAYNAINVVAAIAVACAVVPNIKLEKIQDGISLLKPEAHRLNLLKLEDGREILDDCYNSSPEALSNALELVGKVKALGKRVGLVLGGMHELGEKAAALHAELANQILKLHPHFCFVVGEVGKNFMPTLEQAKFPVEWFSSPAEVIDSVKNSDFNLMLVKGSRGVALEKLIVGLT